MATVVSQHVRYIGILDFSKILFYAKRQQVLLNLVLNMSLQPQIVI